MQKVIRCFSCVVLWGLLFGVIRTHAQDTVVVQTLTLDANYRAGVFEFPEGNDTYEKILMLYRMRCHDAAVGFGNVGCREWDYSCNTFITDSTQVDSTLATHPNYVISNWSENTFPYTTLPVYRYYQYLQQEVTYMDTLSQSEAAIGNGNTSLDFGGMGTGRLQFLLTAAELSAAGLAAGEISGLKLHTLSSGTALDFLRIRIKSTGINTLEAAQPDLNGFTEVYFRDADFPAPGAYLFRFYQAFTWDGVSNLLLDISYTGADGAAPTGLRADPTGAPMAIAHDGRDYSMRFNGATRVLTDPDAFTALSDEVTVSFWVRGDAAVLPANTTIMEGGDDANRRQLNIHLPWGNGQVYWDCGNDGSGYDRINKQANPGDFAGNWNHWAFTKNAASGEMRIYLNGALWHSGAGLNRPIDITRMLIGANLNGSNAYFGNLDELQVWNKALDGNTIQAWMRRPVTPAHPDYSALLLYFPFNEGQGNTVQDLSPAQRNGTIAGPPNWEFVRGKDLFQSMNALTVRPDVALVQGAYTSDQQAIPVTDSLPALQHQVISFAIVNGLPAGIDTQYVNGAGFTAVYDESGNVLSEIPVAAEDTLVVERLSYYTKSPAKFELLSLVTPYGNGLDLGAEGKLFTFDVSDYAPILRGKKRLSIEMGGEWQEELDIRFLFIKGTPPREVYAIQNIWPFRRGDYAAIQNNTVFEPRTLRLPSDGSAFKIRSSITGHGQNGEFVPRDHYLSLGGGAQQFTYSVWKPCGGIPIYPQGGTWLFDRAGWCPGDPTQVHEFDITPFVSPGETTEVDYGVIGPNLTEANYLVANQLVTYGPPSFTLDAAVEDVVRPSRKVEHERFNPACNRPVVRIRNTGSTPLSSLKVHYAVRGGDMKTYDWTGNLDFLETADVTLPVEDYAFWTSGSGEMVFDVSVSQPNGGVDQYPNNNTYASPFQLASLFTGDLRLTYRTNNRGEENAMRVRDQDGNVVLQRAVMADNTTYNDDLELPPGCYTLEFDDAGGDGLAYWYWDAIGQNVGTGYLRLRRRLAGATYITAKEFEPEFGSFVHFDFVVPESVGTQDTESARLFGIRPNPASDRITVELMGYSGKSIAVEIYDLQGRRVYVEQAPEAAGDTVRLDIETGQLADGLYIVRINDGTIIRSRKLVISR